MTDTTFTNGTTLTDAGWFNDVNDFVYSGTLPSGYPTGSFTGTLQGCTTAPTGTIYYVKLGNLVLIDVPSFTGTSNGASKTVTGMPAAIRPATNKKFSCFTSDNGGSYIASIGDLATDGTLEYTTSASGGVWTASGTATIQKMCFAYTTN